MDLKKIVEQLNRIENKVDALHEILKPTKEKKKQASIDLDIDEQIKRIFEFYKENINKRSRLIDKAKKKIKARLNEYTLAELEKAMLNFNKDDWWMKHNAHRGIAWFFHSEERVEQFINLIPQKTIKKYSLFHNNQPCKFLDNKLKIYTPWAGTWLDWNKNHPDYDKFVLKESKSIIAKGKKALDNYIKHQEELL